MRHAEIVGGHAGVYVKGRDSFRLLEPLQAAEGLYCLCDTEGHGMKSSLGLGCAFAEIIAGGMTFTEIRPFRLSRFAEGAAIEVIYHDAG